MNRKPKKLRLDKYTEIVAVKLKHNGKYVFIGDHALNRQQVAKLQKWFKKAVKWMDE